MSYILVSLKHPEQKKTLESVVSYFSDNKLALDFRLYDYKGNFEGTPDIIVFELGSDTSYLSREQLKLYKYAVRYNIQTKIMYLRKSDSSYQFYNFSVEKLDLTTNDQKSAYIHFECNDTNRVLEGMHVLSNLNRWSGNAEGQKLILHSHLNKKKDHTHKATVEDYYFY